MSSVDKKTCPVTGVTIATTYPNPDELVLTQRKMPNGDYQKVMKPRKEVKGALRPVVQCPHMQHPKLAAPEPSASELLEKGKVWCRKIKKECSVL